MAINIEYFTAYISPKDISEDETYQVVDQLAESLNLDKEEIRQKIDKRNLGDQYEVIKRHIPDEKKKSLEEKKITIGLSSELDERTKLTGLSR